MTKAKPQHPDLGFTLLEVLIAFTLVAFVLAAVMQVYSGGLRSTGIAEQRVVASMMAQSKLAEMAAKQPLVPGTETGVSDTGYRWRTTVSKYWEIATGIPDGEPVILYQLAVTVVWGPVERPRTFELSTLRIGSPQEASGEDERR